MDLNELENIILTDIVKYQLKANNIDLRLQLQNLEVIKREYTGIGIYVHFQTINREDLNENLDYKKRYFASPIEIILDTLEYQISFDLNLNQKGHFDFLEIVSNEGNWNGEYNEIKTTANTV